jgi:formiminotetrahydrofolate cyclodeaminase
MNVKINIPSIKDEVFITEISSEITNIIKDGTKIKDGIYKYVNENIG